MCALEWEREREKERERERERESFWVNLSYIEISWKDCVWMVVSDRWFILGLPSLPQLLITHLHCEKVLGIRRNYIVNVKSHLSFVSLHIFLARKSNRCQVKKKLIHLSIKYFLHRFVTHSEGWIIVEKILLRFFFNGWSRGFWFLIFCWYRDFLLYLKFLLVQFPSYSWLILTCHVVWEMEFN